MPKTEGCWANCLDNCSGRLTGEHYVSKSIFHGEAVRVQGMAWCKEPKEIGLSALTKNVLCKGHNEQLSPLDESAKAAFDVIRSAFSLSKERKRTIPGWMIPSSTVRFSANATMFERWLLKVMLNLHANGDNIIGSFHQAPGATSLELVRVVFGIDQFPSPLGMYAAGHVGMQMNTRTDFEYAPLLDQNRVIAGLFILHGMRFLLALELEALRPLGPDSGLEESWKRATLIRPLKRSQATHGPFNATSHFIEWQWDMEPETVQFNDPPGSLRHN